VGLENHVWTLKRTLLQTEVSVVGVQGMGGLGKTTLALALSNDKEIKGDRRFHLFKPFLYPERHLFCSMLVLCSFFISFFYLFIKSDTYVTNVSSPKPQV
jgi:hypothetical protein